MNALIHKVVAILDAHPLVSDIKIVHLDETPSGRVECKVRCRIAGEQQFQVWLHLSAHTIDYAYQLFASAPLLRWDNAPHYSKIKTAPHHFHDEHNNVDSSPLIGEPATDLPVVLDAIVQWLERQKSID